MRMAVTTRESLEGTSVTVLVRVCGLIRAVTSAIGLMEKRMELAR